MLGPRGPLALTAVTEAQAPPIPRVGLTALEAARRLREFGPNVLVPESSTTGALSTLRHIVTDPMAILLAIASLTYVALGEVEDAIIAAIALVPVVGVGVILEQRAEHALESLRRLSAPLARVIRDGIERVVPAAELVPGDAVVLHEGDIVPADAHLVAGADVVADESALTGESQPLMKTLRDAEEAALWAGTTVVSGRGTAIVASTGARTRYGAIGGLIARTESRPTPLQALVRRLFLVLSAVALAFCLAVVAFELWRGATLPEAVIAGVSLAMAAIPEEFPMVFTLYLGLGAWRLARDHALVRRLVGVETLGATSVICVDKTGTLTLGAIEVAELWTAPGIEAGDLLHDAVLASEPQPFDPLDQAIVRRAVAHGVDVTRLHAGELLRDHAFDPETRSVTHVWREGIGVTAYAKGALEAFTTLGVTDAAVLARAREVNEELAGRGMRVIAVGRSAALRDGGDRASDEAGLRLVGLVAFIDPIRPGVAEAIAQCREAGVRVVMITGDHPITAAAVARSLGFGPLSIVTGPELDADGAEQLSSRVATANVFARARPEHKHQLVRALKDHGEIVAMTGDGTNDAPALREADIGVAMGRRGTEVARNAATLVLLDDDFGTIVTAIRDGRRIFENLRRAFSYLVAFHAPLLLTAMVVPIAGAPLFLLPVHFVVLELLLHPTVALVFDADPARRGLMRREPRRRIAGLLRRDQLVTLIARGLTLTIGVLTVYLGTLATGSSEDAARGIAFAALVLGQLLLVLVERSDDTHVWHRLTDNRVLPWVAVATVGVLLLLEAVPAVATRVHLVSPSIGGWGLALAVAAVSTLWGELAKRDLVADD